MVRTVGARDLKTRLGTWLRLVQQGTTLIVTEHGKPVAEIRAIPVAEADEVQSRLQLMAGRGELTLPSTAWVAPVPVASAGPSVSEALVEDREDRF